MIVGMQVVLPMVDPASTVQLTWPIRLDAARSQFRQCHELALVCKLVESRLLKRLRFADSNVHPPQRSAVDRVQLCGRAEGVNDGIDHYL